MHPQRLLLGLFLPLLGSLPALAQDGSGPGYTVQDLGTLGGELANALGINNLGDVVGQAEVEGFASSHFLWSQGVMTAVPGLNPGNNGRADGINELGHVVGSSMAPYPAGPGWVAHAFFWSPAMGPIDLTPAWTGASYAHAINDAGQIAGAATGGQTGGARLWTIDAQGQVTTTAIALPGAPAGFSNEATDINAHGLVVGVGYNADFKYRAWRWQGSGAAVELANLGGAQTIAEGVNDAGEICGTAQLPNNLHVPVKWLPDGTILELGLLGVPNVISSEARGINNHGHVVGAELHIDPNTGLGTSAPWIWIDGTKYALNDLIPAGDLDEWDLRWAIDVNDAGQIVGIAIRTIDGTEYPGRAFLMTPAAAPIGTAYCFGDGSGAACPCGNTGPRGAGCANSSGSGGVITAGGSTSVGADDLAVSATGLTSNQPGLLFAGTSTVAGGAGLPFGDGLRCAGIDVKRLGVAFSSGQGEASWGPGLAAGGGWGAGDTRYLQVWYRDATGSPCDSGFNLSQGLSVTFTP